jgi:putative phage-type endonuclease
VDDAPEQLGNAGTPEERRTGIGGSDAPAALGLSPWRSPFNLWEEKTGLAPPQAQSEPMLWGKLLEDIVRREYARRTGFEVRYRTDMIRHPARPWQFAHLDGEVGADGRRILEVKSARMPQGWGEPETDEIPVPYLVQCHHMLATTAAEVCDVAVLIGGSDFRIYQVRRDIEIEQTLIEGEAAFWESVTQGVPPAPKTLEDAVKRWGRFDAAGWIVAGDAELRAVEILRQGKRLRRELDEAEEAAKLTIMQALGDNGLNLVHPQGELLATWKLDHGRKAYSVEAKEPSRRFLLKVSEEV